MVVGYAHFYAVGDNIRIFKSLYLLKTIYQCKVIVFGNTLMHNFLQYVDFVDESVIIGDLANDGGGGAKAIIDKYCCDYIILTNPRRKPIKALESTNAKCIITGTKIPSLFSKKCKTVPIYLLPHYRNQDGVENLCALVRKINPKLYDSKINTIDLTKSRVKTGKENKRIISDFFQHYIKVLEQKSENINLSKSYLIMVNPFSHSAQRSFRALEWLMLIKKISNLPQCLVLVVTYGSGYDNFMCNLKEAKMDSIPNLLIFQNNHDILNLVEIISRVSCLISPSSGPIHIASNLCIPTIGIYSEHDTKKWATWDRRYVVLKKIQPSIEETEEAIQKTIDLLQECITTKTILPKDIHALCEI